MTQQTINVGSAINDGTGDPARTAFTKCNDNFTELYAANYQPLDADLTSLAAASATNVIYYRSAANTWATVTIGTGVTFSSGTLSATAGAGPFLPLTGGTLSGALSVSYSDPRIAIDKTSSGQSAALEGYNSGHLRWQIVPGDSTAEGGSNTGSNFQINCFADGGGFITTPITIRRDFGIIALGVTGGGYVETGADVMMRCNTSQAAISFLGAGSATYYCQYFRNSGGGYVGNIAFDDSTTTYGTTSDARLKTNAAPFTRGREITDQLLINEFTWTTTGTSDIGVMAQEVYGVYPAAIIRGKGQPGDCDFIPWSVDYSKYVPLLIQALQEAFREIDELKKGK